jgi:hypothetical protein
MTVEVMHVTVHSGVLRVEWRVFDDWFQSWIRRLRRLYHLFGYDLNTWEEAVSVKEAGEEVEMSLGRSV